jgi:hypothetical protein
MKYNKRLTYFESLLNRIKYLESLVYEGKKDLEDLSAYLGDELFNSYMNIRNKIPSESDLNKAYPVFTLEKLEDEDIKKSFIKKYDKLRNHKLINGIGHFLFSKYPQADSNDIEDLLDKYDSMRRYLFNTFNTFRSFEDLKKIDPTEVEMFVDSYDSERSQKQTNILKGSKLIYSDSNWDVYRVTEYPAAVELGKGTKWCITGRYPGNRNRGQEFFDDYIDSRNLDGGYYFYLNKKDPKVKYCILQEEDGDIDSVWDAADNDITVEQVLAREDNWPVVKDVNIDDAKIALLSKDLKRITPIIIHGYNPDRLIGDRTLLEYYCSQAKEYPDIVKFLLEAGANPYIGNPSYYAIKNNYVKTLDHLLDYDDPDTSDGITGRTYLGTAILDNNPRIIKMLLDAGADPNKSIDGNRRNTPLYCVLDQNKTSYTPSTKLIANLLLEAGANPTDQEKELIEQL